MQNSYLDFHHDVSKGNNPEYSHKSEAHKGPPQV